MLNSKFDLYKAEWLDLVFKNRNQQYGAYEMRAHYGEVMMRAMAVTFFTVAMGAGAITIISHLKPVVPADPIVRIIPVTNDIVHVIPEQKAAEKPKEAEPIKQQPKATPVSTQNLNMKVVKDDQVKVDPKPFDPKVASGPVDMVVPGGDTEIQNPTMGTTDGKEAGVPAAPDNGIRDAGDIQVLPEPVGGAGAWSKFLQKNLRYPYAAQEQGVSGKVFLSFIIEKDGHLSDITVIRKANYGFDEEALRVLKLAPAWKPGIQNGQPVRVRYTIPINFQISE
jgi:protein TonB